MTLKQKLCRHRFRKYLFTAGQEEVSCCIDCGAYRMLNVGLRSEYWAAEIPEHMKNGEKHEEDKRAGH